MSFFTTIRGHSTSFMNDIWVWFSKLNQQEWFVLLGIVAILGFLCMKGMTQRGHV